MRQPRSRAGTNAPVVGVACRRVGRGGSAPRASGSAVVHVFVIVSLVPADVWPMIRNVADAGIVRHVSRALVVPRSSDQSPPGVCGWFAAGKARTCTTPQPVAVQVPLA